MENKLLLIILDGVPLRNWRRLFGNLEGWVASGEAQTWTMRSVLPSTSASCYASIHTGVTPQQHGCTGNGNVFRLDFPDVFSQVRKGGGVTGAVTHSFWSQFFNRHPFDLVRDLEYDEPDSETINHGRFHTMTGYGQINQMTPSDVDLFATLSMLCGRFEGVDERVLEAFGIQEVSLGDFVMTGGEIAAQAMLDATVRLLPGVLGNAESAVEESFSNGLLEHPQYTKPATWEGRDIPEVLLSGNHGRIADWRQDQAEQLTRERRPEILELSRSEMFGRQPSAPVDLKFKVFDETHGALGGKAISSSLRMGSSSIWQHHLRSIKS